MPTYCLVLRCTDLRVEIHDILCNMEPLTTPDTYTRCHYTSNRPILTDPTVNVTFDAVVRMSALEFTAWMERVRHAILTQWDTQQVPPRVGMSDAEMDVAWHRLMTAHVADVWTHADDGASCLSAPATSHSVIGQWFPTMMKTRINYTAKDVGISIYDMFARDEIWARYVKSYASRHFRRDSFYAYSRAVHTHESIPTRAHMVATSAQEYLTLLRDYPTPQQESLFGDQQADAYSLWLAPALGDDDYSGYSEHLKNRKIWTLTHEEAIALRDSGAYPAQWFHAVQDTLTKKSHYMVRLYDTSSRIFPDGFKSFRVSMCQYAVNWPALAARALYERYTHGITSPVVWDPSCGWAGRLVGAITAQTKPLYIGCDPNTDHVWVDETGIPHSKYTEIAAYHDARLPFDDEPSKVLFFPCGSEEMQHQPAFHPYRGKVDVVFTSPPYFNREAYSENDAQSYKKFMAFEDWCEGFLKPTLETAAQWLKPGGVLLWNIADIKHGKDYLPLEAKSSAYAIAAGLIQEETIRLLMANMPGANRVDDAGQGTAKNTCKVNGRLIKYEPIFVFRKPV